MEVTVVREVDTEGGRHIKEMSDGRIVVSPTKKQPGTQYGAIETIYGEVTEEKLTEAKTKVVDEVCRMIREIAKRDDFFIIKPSLLGDATTVAHKFFLPTVEEDVE